MWDGTLYEAGKRAENIFICDRCGSRWTNTHRMTQDLCPDCRIRRAEWRQSVGLGPRYVGKFL